jgi:putative lipoprotein
MKKIYLILILSAGILFGQTNQTDTTITKINISDVQFYSLQKNDQIEAETQKALKPFSLIQPEDKWFSKDKWMHLSTAYFLTLQSTYALDKMFYTRSDNARYVSVGISLSLSLGKEFYDAFYKKSIFSWKDLVYDILGSGLGYLTLTSLQK